MTGKHRQSEVILRQSDKLMTSPSQAPPTGMRLTRRVQQSGWCRSVSHCDGQVYVGVRGGVYLLTNDGPLSCVISVEGMVWSVSICDNLIYTLIQESKSWTVRVYGSDYQPIRSWRHDEKCKAINQLAVRKDSVFVPDRDSKTIVKYSLAGEVQRCIPCPTLSSANTCLCVMPLRRDAMIVSCNETVSFIGASTGHYVWIIDSLERPAAVCCDGAERVYVAVGG